MSPHYETEADPAVVRTWRARSAEFFHVVKKRREVPDEWEFSLVSPDVVPQAGIGSSLDDPKAVAAFMLRRLQAQRFLIDGDDWGLESTQLSLGYLSDLSSYVSGLIDGGGVREETEVETYRNFRSATNQLLSYIADHYATLRGTA